MESVTVIVVLLAVVLLIVCISQFQMFRRQKEHQSKTRNHDMRLDWLGTSWETLRSRNDTKISRDDLVYCKDCGGLVLKADAVKGPARIEQQDHRYPVCNAGVLISMPEDVIVYDYFCPRCNEKKPSEPTKVTVSSGLESSAIHLHTAYRESWRNALRTLNLDKTLPEDRIFIEKMTGIKLQDEREPKKEAK